MNRQERHNPKRVDLSWQDQSRCDGAEDIDWQPYVLPRSAIPARFRVIAKMYCAQCPVRIECRDYAARTDSMGIWGGMYFYVQTNADPQNLL